MSNLVTAYSLDGLLRTVVAQRTAQGWKALRVDGREWDPKIGVVLVGKPYGFRGKPWKPPNRKEENKRRNRSDWLCKYLIIITT